VFGKDAMALNVDKWHQGNVDIADGKATLLVFWEVWCPHCKREVPKMQKIHDDYGPKGLQVVGLTKQSRDKSDADVMAFLEENDVKYPTARENGDISTHYGVRGVPAAAVVKDGKVVWRGHPSRITPAMMDGWTGS
jgi:thiol-disulfide isomerase/thioredoxin